MAPRRIRPATVHAHRDVTILASAPRPAMRETAMDSTLGEYDGKMPSLLVSLPRGHVPKK